MKRFGFAKLSEDFLQNIWVYKLICVALHQKQINIKSMNEISDNNTVHIRPISELHPSVQAFVGIARKKGEPEIMDVNGESLVEI